VQEKHDALAMRNTEVEDAHAALVQGLRRIAGALACCCSSDERETLLLTAGQFGFTEQQQLSEQLQQIAMLQERAAQVDALTYADVCFIRSRLRCCRSVLRRWLR
jgi:hypothetical protein